MWLQLVFRKMYLPATIMIDSVSPSACLNLHGCFLIIDPYLLFHRAFSEENKSVFISAPLCKLSWKIPLSHTIRKCLSQTLRSHHFEVIALLVSVAGQRTNFNDPLLQVTQIPIVIKTREDLPFHWVKSICEQVTCSSSPAFKTSGPLL